IRRQKTTPLFKDAMAQFLEHSRQQHAEHPNTTKSYANSSKPLVEAFGTKKLHAIASDEIEKYKTARLKGGRRVHGKKGETKETGRGVKPATVNRDLACM